MASPSTGTAFLALVIIFLALLCAATTANARFTAMQWTPAHATFYGDETAAETMGTLLTIAAGIALPRSFPLGISHFSYGQPRATSSYRWGVRIWQPVRDRVRHGHGGAEHDAVQGRARLRDVLPDPVHGFPVVLRRLAVDHGDGHQPVPAQLGAGHQQRRVVQPAAHPLRPLQAGLHEDGAVARRDRARHVPPRALRAQGRPPVRAPGEPLLAAGVRDERRRRRRRRRDVGEERHVVLRVDTDDPQLGRRVPGVRAARRQGAQLQGHLLHHPADHRRHQRRAGELGPGAHVPGPRQLLLRAQQITSICN